MSIVRNHQLKWNLPCLSVVHLFVYLSVILCLSLYLPIGCLSICIILSNCLSFCPIFCLLFCFSSCSKLIMIKLSKKPLEHFYSFFFFIVTFFWRPTLLKELVICKETQCFPLCHVPLRDSSPKTHPHAISNGMSSFLLSNKMFFFVHTMRDVVFGPHWLSLYAQNDQAFKISSLVFHLRKKVIEVCNKVSIW